MIGNWTVPAVRIVAFFIVICRNCATDSKVDLHDGSNPPAQFLWTVQGFQTFSTDAGTTVSIRSTRSPDLVTYDVLRTPAPQRIVRAPRPPRSLTPGFF